MSTIKSLQTDPSMVSQDPRDENLEDSWKNFVLNQISLVDGLPGGTKAIFKILRFVLTR